MEREPLYSVEDVRIGDLGVIPTEQVVTNLGDGAGWLESHTQGGTKIVEVLDVMDDNRALVTPYNQIGGGQYPVKLRDELRPLTAAELEQLIMAEAA